MRMWLKAGVSVGALLAFTGVAFAQDASDGLETITVTAQKRSQNAQNVPIAITSISADRLAASNITDTQGLAATIPGLEMPASAGFALPHVRGIGASVNAPGDESPVSIYVDGVYIASAAGDLMDLTDVSGVDLLKGPQGTLFGRNATGGVLMISTRDPGTDPEADFHLGYGNYSTVQGDAYIAGQVANDVTANLAAQFLVQGDGYGTNLYNHKDLYKTDRDISARTKWVFTLSPTTTVKLSADYSDNANSNSGARLFPGDTSALGPLPVKLNSPYDGDVDIQTLTSTQTGGVSATVDQQLGDLLLTSISAYRGLKTGYKGDFDVTPNPGLGLDWRSTSENMSQELRLQNGDGHSLSWTIGGYYFYAHDDFAPEDILQGGPIAAGSGLSLVQIRDREITESEAVFGQATYALFPDTNLTAGIRYTWESRKLGGEELIEPVGTSTLLPAVPNLTGNVDFSKVTWRGAIDHHFTPDLLGYVSYNTGFKSGGFNLSGPTAPAYLPESLKAWEVGVKSDLFDNRLRLNPSLFYYTYDNIQEDAYTAVGGSQIVYNGAGSKLYGLDLDFDALVADQLTLSGGLEWMHSEFTAFPDAAIGIPLPTGGDDLIAGSAKGNQLPYAPNFEASIQAMYTVPSSSGPFDLSLQYLYNSGYYGTADNLLHQASYNMLNASIQWSPAGTNMTVQLWGKNLGNVPVLVTMAEAAVAGNFEAFAPPRTFGVKVGYHF